MINPNKMTEEEQIQFVLDNPNNIRFIYNPSVEVQKEAVQEYPEILSYIKNPAIETVKLALEEDFFSLDYIHEQTEEIQLFFVSLLEDPCEEDETLITTIKNPSEKVQLEIIKIFTHYIKYIKNPTNKTIKTAIKKTPEVISYIDDPSEELQKIAVSQKPSIVYNIKNPSLEVQSMALDHVVYTFELQEYIIVNKPHLINDLPFINDKLQKKYPEIITGSKIGI